MFSRTVIASTARMLDHHANAEPARRARVRMRWGEPSKMIRPSSGARDAVDHLDEGGLSGAVFAEEGIDFAGLTLRLTLSLALTPGTTSVRRRLETKGTSAFTTTHPSHPPLRVPADPQARQTAPNARFALDPAEQERTPRRRAMGMIAFCRTLARRGPVSLIGSYVLCACRPPSERQSIAPWVRITLRRGASAKAPWDKAFHAMLASRQSETSPEMTASLRPYDETLLRLAFDVAKRSREAGDHPFGSVSQTAKASS